MEYFVENESPFHAVIVDDAGRRYGRAMPDDTVNFTQATGSLGQSQYICRYTGDGWDSEGYPNFGQGLDITDGHDGSPDTGEYHEMGIGAHHVDTFIGRVAAWDVIKTREVRGQDREKRSATKAELVAVEKHLIDQGFLLFLRP